MGSTIGAAGQLYVYNERASGDKKENLLVHNGGR